MEDELYQRIKAAIREPTTVVILPYLPIPYDYRDNHQAIPEHTVTRNDFELYLREAQARDKDVAAAIP
jgi:hypothetical protein